MSRYPYNDTMSPAEFQQAIRDGRLVPDGRGGYITREAALSPLAALAESRSSGRKGTPPSNTSGAYVYGGGEGDVDGFRAALDRRRRGN